MARVKRAVHGRKHHRAILEQARGYYGNKSRSFKAANEQVMHSLQYAYRDRKARKGDFRQLWIQRINAGARQHGMSYSRFIAGLREAGVEVDYLRLRALPLEETLRAFVARHERVYVVELNYDGQMCQLVRLEVPELAGRVRSLAHCDGLPLTARFITEAILEQEQ